VPTTSIDAFFACTLLVTVALIVTASFAAAMQTNIESLQGANDQNYLKSTAEQLTGTVGFPSNWGTTSTVPEIFGLAKVNGQAYELDVDKLCRLNSHCTSALTYEVASNATRLYNLAFAISLVPMLTVSIQPTSNSTNGITNTYNFQVNVDANQNPTAAAIESYLITENQVSTISATASSLGQANLSFQLPVSTEGPVLIVTFAKANMDERLTSYVTYNFTLPFDEQQSNPQILTMSPLDNKLTINATQPDTTVSKVYSLSFGHQSQLAQSGSNYTIPKLLGSPIVLVATGTSQTEAFVEWTGYPNMPLRFGSEFANTQQSTFAYTVTINDVLYKLTVTLGEISQ
jgi:hypothetical protein